MNMIALTGGTLGGKTTIIKKLKTKYGEKIITIPEVPTLLFENEFKRPKKWTLEWHYSLQRGILEKQLELEESAKTQAIKYGIKVIVCDRGMLDPSAYLENGRSQLIQQFGLDEKEALGRYDLILHLISLSVLDPDLYKKHILSNPHRIETLDEAIRQEAGSLQAWENHPNRIIFSNELEKSEQRIFEIIDPLIY